MRLSFVAILFMFVSSCTMFMDKNRNEALEDKVWALVPAEENKEVFNKPRTLKLNKETNRFSSFAGCNTVNGSYKLTEKNGLELTVLQQTYKACQNIELEKDYIDMLKLVDSYKFINAKLVLFDQDKEVATFK